MRQVELFSIETPAHVEVPGLSLTPDHVTEQQGRDLIELVDRGPWETEWRRRIQEYGLGYASEHGGTPQWIRDFPAWLSPLADRVAKDAAFVRFPENCVINEYIPPLGIGPHRDYPAFGDPIACVSLGSDIVIDFRHATRGTHVPVFVPRRSFWVITGEARNVWTHGIAARLTDLIDGVRHPRGRRLSITFRIAKDR